MAAQWWKGNGRLGAYTLGAGANEVVVIVTADDSIVLSQADMDAIAAAWSSRRFAAQVPVVEAAQVSVPNVAKAPNPDPEPQPEFEPFRGYADPVFEPGASVQGKGGGEHRSQYGTIVRSAGFQGGWVVQFIMDDPGETFVLLERDLDVIPRQKSAPKAEVS